MMKLYIFYYKKTIKYFAEIKKHCIFAKIKINIKNIIAYVKNTKR